MFRTQTARLATGVVGALLGVMLLGTAGVTAANTRIVCLGTSGNDADCSSFDSSGNIVPGTLELSPVTTDGTTAGNSGVKVVIRNDSGSPLNHVKFAGGDVADGLPYNQLFPSPAKPSFGGATLTALIPSPNSCAVTSTGFLCDLGTLKPKASAVFTVVLNPPPAVGVDSVWLTASWNEGWSTTGSNADYTFATGTITISTPSCSLGTANYFLPGDRIDLSDGGLTCQNERGSVGGGPLGGNGGFGSLGIDSPSTTPACPAGVVSAKFSCYGTTVSVVINGGVTVPGGVQWTVTWFGIKSLTGVIHYLDNYDPNKSSTYVTIPLTKKFQCSSTLTTNCWVSVTASNGSANPLWVQVIFVTPNNGKGGGFI